MTAAIVATLLSSGAARAQSDGSASAQSAVILVKLHDPVFPQIARTAHVTGDIHLIVHVRQDGSVESVEYVSGPPLLEHASEDSAKASEYECRGCADAVTSYPLIYTFQFIDGPGCLPSNFPPKISWTPNHVSISANPVCLGDPTGTVVHVRSIKCLYLWKCATQ